MNGKRTLFGLVAALAIVGAFVLASAPGDGTDLAAARAEDPSAEGITVHGHWRLDIVEPDGSLNRTIEFDNALVSGGRESLARILGRDLTPGEWTIRIDGSPRPCATSEDLAVHCVMQENPNNAGETFVFDNLTLDVSTPGELTLAGAATIANTTAIDLVATTLWHCDSTVAPADALSCGSANERIFTTKTAASPDFDEVPVEAGQVVQVFVTLTFS